jgi:hypothetical protein
MKVLVVLGMCLVLLSACQPREELVVLPTVAQVEEMATASFLTQVAPPSGFSSVNFPQIDQNLNQLDGFRYDVSLSFEGTFARTPRQTRANTQVTVQANTILSARRVVATIDNDLVEESDALRLEGVQLGEDIFLLRDGTCITNSEEEARATVELSAGVLVGGVQNVNVAPRSSQVVNGQQVWAYTLTPESLVLPNVNLGTEGRITAFTGELWVAPENNVVVRYYVNLDVENAVLFGGELPVTGTILLRYDVYDIGTLPSINVPFGC